MNKIKVAHLIYKLNAGGAENGIINLCNTIDTNQFIPYIITFKPDGELTFKLNQSKTKLIELNKRNGNDPRLIYWLYKIFKKENIHIVHTHAWGTLVEGILSAKLARVHVIIHGEHGTIEQRKRNIIVQRYFWNLTDCIISISSSLKKRLIDTIGFKDTEKIIPVVNGVDTEKFYPVEDKNKCRKQLGLPENAFIIGTVGRLVPVKDQKTLIKTLAILKKDIKNIICVIVGDGPLYNELKEFARALYVEKSVYFPGVRKDINTVMSSFDVFTLTSLSEGISNTILEAMACGLPIVATKVGGTVEIIKHEENGILVPPQQPEILAEKIKLLIDNHELIKKYSNTARQWAVEKFSLKKITKQYESIYLKYLKKGGLSFV